MNFDLFTHFWLSCQSPLYWGPRDWKNCCNLLAISPPNPVSGVVGHAIDRCIIDRTKEVSVVDQNTRLMNKNKTHCNGGLSPLPCQRFKKKATSMEAAVEFKHQLFQLERNTKHNGLIFTHYPVNASENGDFNRGRKSFMLYNA